MYLSVLVRALAYVWDTSAHICGYYTLRMHINTYVFVGVLVAYIHAHVVNWIASTLLVCGLGSGHQFDFVSLSFSLLKWYLKSYF